MTARGVMEKAVRTQINSRTMKAYTPRRDKDLKLKPNARSKGRVLSVLSDVHEALAGGREAVPAMLKDLAAAQGAVAPGRTAASKLDLETGAKSNGGSSMVDINELGAKFAAATKLVFPSIRLAVQSNLLELALHARGQGLGKFRKRGGWLKLREAGFEGLGRQRWRKVLKRTKPKGKTGNPGFVYEAGSRKIIARGQRPTKIGKRKEIESQVAETFIANSEPCPAWRGITNRRTLTKNANKVALEIAERLKINKRLALKLMPSNIKKPLRKTDLCCICEELHRARRKESLLLKKLSEEHPGEECRDLGSWARCTPV